MSLKFKVYLLVLKHGAYLIEFSTASTGNPLFVAEFFWCWKLALYLKCGAMCVSIMDQTKNWQDKQVFQMLFCSGHKNIATLSFKYNNRNLGVSIQSQAVTSNKLFVLLRTQAWEALVACLWYFDRMDLRNVVKSVEKFTLL